MGPGAYRGHIQNFKLGGGGARKKIAPSEGRRENCWGISCEKSRFYAKKSYIFQFYGGGGCAPHGSAPAYARKITPMSSIEIAFYIHNLIIIIVSLDIHVYVYYTVFTKLLQEIYFENCFYDVPI